MTSSSKTNANSSRPANENKDVERPEGDMTVGSTSAALGGDTHPAARPHSPDAKAPVDGTGLAEDGKRSASNSGTSSTSVGNATSGAGQS